MKGNLFKFLFLNLLKIILRGKDYMNIEKVKWFVKEKLLEKCYNYFLRVLEIVIKLVEIYDGDISKVELVGVLYDFCKYDDLGKMY